MDKIIIVAAIIVVCVIGLILKLKYIFDLNKRHEFVIEYHNKFVDLINGKMSGTFDQINYTWLMKNVHKMHAELGAIGYVNYVDKLHGIQATNHALLLNFLAEVQQEDDIRNPIIAKRMMDSAKTCSDMFIRHDGDLSEWKEETKKEVCNPFSLFGEGFRYIVHLPINCFYWLGLISLETAGKIKTNIFVKMIEKMFMLLSLLSAVVTIVIGWNEFVVIIDGIFENFKSIWN